jgi:hypothetical protein
MGDELRYDKMISTIIEYVNSGQLNSREDLKLFGVRGDKFQKEIMWKVFEHIILNEEDETKKSDTIRFFYRANLLK